MIREIRPDAAAEDTISILPHPYSDSYKFPVSTEQAALRANTRMCEIRTARRAATIAANGHASMRRDPSSIDYDCPQSFVDHASAVTSMSIQRKSLAEKCVQIHCVRAKIDPSAPTNDGSQTRNSIGELDVHFQSVVFRYRHMSAQWPSWHSSRGIWKLKQSNLSVALPFGCSLSLVQKSSPQSSESGSS